MIDAFLLSVSLAVAAVPEGLPAVVTVSLALGLQRMVRRKALIRSLPSVETLGSVTVICSDKTGTLTRNEMTVREVAVGDTRYSVTGSGYAPRGEFRQRTTDGQAAMDPANDPDLGLLLTIASQCNHAQVFPIDDEKGLWQVVGDPTEGALIVAALKAGVQTPERGRHVVYELPFDSNRKMMSVVVRQASGDAALYAKGAPEAILSRCAAERRHGQVMPLIDERRQEIMQCNAQMASAALRVLAFAYRDYPADVDDFAEANLTFSGLTGLIDPPREEVKQAVATCGVWRAFDRS